MDISVVLVTCDRPADVLMRAYNSVRNQSVCPKEFIVVNAGSGSIPKLEGCTIVDAFNSNASVARNIGARKVTSDFIAFLDDDDEWLPKHLESQMPFLNEDTALVYSEMKDKGIWDMRESDIMVRNWIGPTSFVSVSKKRFDEVGGFDESFASNQEWDLWIRLSRLGNVVTTGIATVVKYDLKDSISHHTDRRISGWVSLLNKHESEYRRRPEVFSKVTKVFLDEMIMRYSLRGMMIAVRWHLYALSELPNI